MEQKTELQKQDIKRFSNEETNRITKGCIQSALIVLMSEKPFDKIAITEIVKRSGVSRTAFYRNFSSKEDVLAELSASILGDINQMVLSAIQDEDPHRLYCRIFQRIRDDREDFDVMLKAGLYRSGYLDIDAYVKNRYPHLDPMMRYAVVGWWGALQDIIKSWYLGGMREEIRDMADLCCQLFQSMTEIQACKGERI